jgi:hypothetical protein
LKRRPLNSGKRRRPDLNFPQCSGGGLWIRVSGQVYNEIGDYHRLAVIG